MKHYKAPDNSLHAIEPEFAYMLPDGCVEITEAEAEVIRAARDTLPQVELIAATMAKARTMRFDILKVLDGLQTSAMVTAATVLVGDPPASQPLALVIEQLKQGLRDLPQTVDLSACTTREEMESVVLAAYYTLASSAPAQVRGAFNSLVG